MNETHDDLTALSLLDDPVRRRLYDWIASQGRPVGREEAAKALDITRPLAAFHLDKLAAAGLLDADYRRLTGRVGPGAGRPARVYWRARRDFNVAVPARRYDRAAEILATALEGLDKTAVRAELDSAASRFGAELGGQPGRGAPRRRLLSTLETAGYEPHLDEVGAIRLRNCPFDALVERHRSLVCGTNLALAQGLVQAIGPTGFEPVLDRQPGYCCVAFVPAADADGSAAAADRVRSPEV